MHNAPCVQHRSGALFYVKSKRSLCQKSGEDFVAFPGKEEIFFSYSSFIMGGKRQCHLVKTYINIRLMIDFESLFGDSAHKINARHESFNLKVRQIVCLRFDQAGTVFM